MTPAGEIPRIALFLGLAGTLPFIAAAAMIAAPAQIADATGAPLLSVRFLGSTIAVIYARTILSFMSGALWGFATNARGKTAIAAYTASVIPALFVFFSAVLGPAVPSLTPLAIGYAAILVLDWLFWRAGLAPTWWMRLRVIITVIVLICLTIAILNS